MNRDILYRCRATILILCCLGSATPLWAEESKTHKVLEQKLQLLEQMINGGKGAQQLHSSANPEVQALLQQAEELMQMATGSLKRNEYDDAGTEINDAIRALTSARAKAKGERGSTLSERQHYRELLTNIASMEQAIQANPAITINQPRIDQLRHRAADLIKKDQYGEAIKQLDEAYQMTVTALALGHHNKTVVYALNFASAKEEYEYERNRYRGNQELVTLMLDQRPSSPTKRMIEGYVSKAQHTFGEAHAASDSGAHTEALKIIERANSELSRAMKMLGINF